MYALLNQLAALLLAAESNDPQTLIGLPKILRELAEALKTTGDTNQSTTFAQRATMIDSLRDDADAIGVILSMLGGELEALQRAHVADESIDVAVIPSTADGPTANDQKSPVESSSFSTALSEPAVTEGDDPELVLIFLAEANEHLEAAEKTLLKLEQAALDAHSINQLFRQFHSIKGTARFVNLHEIADLALASEDLIHAARSGQKPLNATSIQALIEGTDALRKAVRTLQLVPSASSISGYLPAFTQRLAQVLNDDVATSASSPTPTATTAKPEPASPADDALLNASLVTNATATNTDEKLAQSSTSTSATTKSSSLPTPTAAATTSASASSSSAGAAPAEAVRVDRARLDQLINLVGELVICESMVQESFGVASESEVENRCLHQLRTITRELQGLSLGLRMVPITSLFQKGMRLVRDLSRKLNKPVDVQLVGEDTELDKTVVDQISDPLVHIIRNSMDHGIEPSPADRVAAGKPERATIQLKAFHQSGDICIEISDDGRGLNRERIMQKAVERGLIKPDQPLSDDEVCDLIFRPGFSTAEKVTDLSGRGVGMDVVRQNIAALRGTVSMTSVEGHGTRLLIRLPLTLGIIDGMIVRSANERFIVPTSVIVELIQPQAADISQIQHRGTLLNVRGQSVPFFRLDHSFGMKPASTQSTAGLLEGTELSSDGIVVLVEDKDRLAGLYVDQVIGRQQVVIKGLQGIEGDLKSFAGCAVMPDGLVGLILDVPATLERARRATTVA